ncbi:uncharacterized protein CYBJADRAFT_59111 [Cyberlindnera jadinii NRRL Y-1542]|uniref:Uncharacterized protein n=1 Tax=Cyberlindnera jadinii (strain ATCC 18201 / CBS 1600 / BCRC 20928 / JCM 3617 / NBRC 0987 / NRRL Y-1542) TaxID=983966 RepID=A0A1E4S560_CYBJN|nr:hypothetical protein CYBJADRAFT_59111 [Cyberlindnera jadinii NRRL Y-1542]ODV74583.1 hypothetical protein CYBJADRAFT_59111 [Cyberlindnera jadinii NRRL Y-1542]
MTHCQSNDQFMFIFYLLLLSLGSSLLFKYVTLFEQSPNVSSSGNDILASSLIILLMFFMIAYN